MVCGIFFTKTLCSRCEWYYMILFIFTISWTHRYALTCIILSFQPPWDFEVGKSFIIHYTYGCDYNLKVNRSLSLSLSLSLSPSHSNRRGPDVLTVICYCHLLNYYRGSETLYSFVYSFLLTKSCSVGHYFLSHLFQVGNHPGRTNIWKDRRMAFWQEIIS